MATKTGAAKPTPKKAGGKAPAKKAAPKKAGGKAPAKKAAAKAVKKGGLVSYPQSGPGRPARTRDAVGAVA